MEDSKIENTLGQCQQVKRSTQDSMSGANVVNQKTDPQHVCMAKKQRILFFVPSLKLELSLHRITRNCC